MYVHAIIVYVLIPLGWIHESDVSADQMDNIWHAWRPCTSLTPIPHTQRYSRHHLQHETAVYDSALQGSIQCQALPSDQLFREIPTHPASSHLSTLPVWLAANTGQDEQSCIRNPATLEGQEVHQVGIRRVYVFMYIHVCTLFEHVHTLHSSVCTWTRQNITKIFDCVCRRLSMTSIDG